MNRSDLNNKLNNATITEETAGLKNKPSSVEVDEPTIFIKGPKEVVMAKNHALLDNLEYEKSGHKGFAGIKFGTTAEWNSDPSYVAAKGVLIVYTDYKTEVDEHGELIYYPNFKIGDGNAYLIDKPFVGDDLRKKFAEHINNEVIHITQQEREFWNNKLNYNEPEGDLLEFTRN